MSADVIDLLEGVFSDPLNQFILLPKGSRVVDALQNAKRMGSSPDWWLLVPTGKSTYLGTRLGKLQEHLETAHRERLSGLLTDCAEVLEEIKAVESPTSIADLRAAQKKSPRAAVVVTLLGTIVGLISPGTLTPDTISGDAGAIFELGKQAETTGTRPSPAKRSGIAGRIESVRKFIQDNVAISIVSFIILTLFPTAWFFAREVFPTLMPEYRVMTGEWNIGVLKFVSVGDEDVSDAEIDLIGDVFYNRLAADMGEIAGELDLVIQVAGPDELRSIRPSEVENREAIVEEIARDSNADIIIYGTIEKRDNVLLIYPEFYVSIQNFYEAEDMVGQHSLGGTISIQEAGEGLAGQIGFNREMSNRLQILSYVTQGLSHFYVHAYEDALQAFASANSDEYWREDLGREVIHLFVGFASLRTDDLDQAEAALRDALLIEPGYARALVGLGSIEYLRAVTSMGEGDFELALDLLDSAQSYYIGAVGADYQPASADISVKAAFGLGQVKLARWFAGEGAVQDAIDQFLVVIDAYQGSSNSRIQEIASESYARIGLIYREIGENDQSLSYFSQALELSTSPDRRALYLATIADLYESLGDMQAFEEANASAIEEYARALTLTTDPEHRSDLWSRIARRHEAGGNIEEAAQAVENAIREASSAGLLTDDLESWLSSLQTNR